MKHLHIILGLTAVLAVGCAKDPGNYDYMDMAQVVPGMISGIEKSYTVISFDKLEIKPEIEDEQPRYEYTWYARMTSGTLNASDENMFILGNDKDLDYQVTLKAGTYLLVLQAHDPQYGTDTYFKTTLYVVSEFSRGWFVLKDKDGVTDIDLFKPDGTKNENVLSALHGLPLVGEAVGTGYHRGYYNYQIENPDGTVTTKRGQDVLFAVSTKDMHVYDANTMERVKTLDDAFFEMPSELNFQGLFLEWQGIYCINNSKLHRINTLGTGYGIFSYHLPGDYELSPFAMTESYSGALFFDSKSSSFRGMKGANSSLVMLRGDNAAPCNDMDCDMIFMAEREVLNKMGNSAGLGIMRNRTSGDYYAFRVNKSYSSGANPIEFFDKIQTGKKIVDAKVYAVNCWNNDIYFSAGDNKISYYTLSNQNETELKLDIPADEKITYIRHINNSNCYALAVITSKGDKWKMYLYEFVEWTSGVDGRVFAEPFSGEGNARHVMYRNTNSQFVN